MSPTMLEFWFDFASSYSYVAAMQIEDLCRAADIPLIWKPFLLGPIFELQGLKDSPFNVYPRRGAYMWRDLERLAHKYHFPFRRPTHFPRSSTLAARVACILVDEPWCADYVRRVFVANFGDDEDISSREVLSEIIDGLGHPGASIIDDATSESKRGLLRANTSRAIELGMFGAPNCVVDGELFWGEEALDDAIDWARRVALKAPS